MSHIIWHCGIVGTESRAGPFTWPKYSNGIVAWKLNEWLPDRVERRVEKHARRMARLIADKLGGPIVESMIDGHCILGIGDVDGDAVIPEHDTGSDYLMTYAFESESLGHAAASALDTELNIERYESYLDVYEATGGEIHSY